MYISLYQEYQNEETNTYVSELSLLFRRSSCQRCQISMSTGNTLEKALNKIGREDIVKKCIFNVELVTDDVEKAVARVRLDQPGFDSLKEELGPSRDTSLRRDATMDPKMDPDYDEFNKTKGAGSIEDLNISATKRDTPKQHVTITNGTVFNGTSTPIKDKYASDEKELRDVMADFLEHKCHVTDTMSKKSRDELDDEDKKRQRVIADANRIVSDVTEEAARRAQALADQAYSMSKTGHDSAEIDGTVERHATSAPTKQPVPAPRHSTRSSIKTDFHLDLGDTSCAPYSPKHKTKESKLQEEHSPEKSSPKSKIPIKVKKSMDNEKMACKTGTDKVKSDVEDAKQLEKSEPKGDSVKTELSSETCTTMTTKTTASALDSETLEKLAGTVEKIETVTIAKGDARPGELVRETKIVESWMGPEEAGTITKTVRNVTDQVVKETVVKTITTTMCTTMESVGTDQTERIVRTVTTSGDYGDIPGLKRLQGDILPLSIEQGSTKMMKSISEMSEPWAHGSLIEHSYLNDEKVEQWESQLSQDTSPGSGNGDIYAKNGSSRHDLNSDTDSDGSPRPRRRSPSKRRTLGSSSGSDVALHEGAELSPLEDDQGTALTANLLSKQCT